MFGYVLPYVSELKVKEYEQFRSCYCSLCHELGRRYGFPARMILNYDFTLLAMLLWDENEQTCRKKCFVHPFRKTHCYPENSALRKAAGLSIILFWWKLRDSLEDKGISEKLKAFCGIPILFLSYRKAKADYPEFDVQVRESLRMLRILEKENETSLDKMADCFAVLLSCAGNDLSSSRKERVIKQQLYHLGRWIYLVDAVDDLKKDQKKGAYNVVAVHYQLSPRKELSTAQKEDIRGTITQSSNSCIHAFELMECSVWTPVLSNILYLGLPAVCNSVLSGTFRTNKHRIP